ncbi:hypothetical protein GQR58_007770 [Nymphon striatum]|nr:hypothetical protein GQR58_007770 [Nymphon striatum]
MNVPLRYDLVQIFATTIQKNQLALSKNKMAVLLLSKSQFCELRLILLWWVTYQVKEKNNLQELSAWLMEGFSDIHIKVTLEVHMDFSLKAENICSKPGLDLDYGKP